MIRTKKLLRQRQGMALVLTIMVIALLTVVVFERFNDAWVEAALADSFRDETKAYFGARSGMEAARLILKEDARNNIEYDALTEEWAQGTLPIPLDDEFVFVAIRDESGKFNLNQLTSLRGYPQERWITLFINLLTTLELDTGLVDTTIDWIDQNEEIREQGAEDGFYMEKTPAYRAKNNKLDSIDELAMVKGFTPEIIKTLRPFITVFDTKKININTATPELLFSLDSEMTKLMVEAIMSIRSQRPFKRREEIKTVPGMAPLYPRIALLIDVRSDIYSVESQATFDDTNKTIRAVYQRNAERTATLYYKVF